MNDQITVCQVQHLNEDILTCPARESGGYRCERTDPHDTGHHVGDHTIRHALIGNGYTCACA